MILRVSQSTAYTRLAWLWDVLWVLGGAYLIAVGARARVTLAFTPVPITMQTLVVLILGALAGARRGGFAALAYLIAGSMGLPFFAGGALWGPTGGYLVGFVAAAWLLGALMASGWGDHLLTAALAVLMASGVIYLFGLPWLATFVGPSRVLALGFSPFVLGDLAKAVVTTGMILAAGRRLRPDRV